MIVGDFLLAAINFLTVPTWHLIVLAVVILVIFAAVFVGSLGF
jgi:hypothetical protein